MGFLFLLLIVKWSKQKKLGVRREELGVGKAKV